MGIQFGSGWSGVTSQTGCCLSSLSSISPFPSTFRLLIPLYPCRRSSSSSFLEAARAREFDISQQPSGQWIHHPTLTHRPPPIYNMSPFSFLYGRTESSSSSVLTSNTPSRIIRISHIINNQSSTSRWFPQSLSSPPSLLSPLRASTPSPSRLSSSKTTVSRSTGPLV